MEVTKSMEGEIIALKEALKKNTIELERMSRELEIEAALEQVRVAAMAMNKAEDMLGVCRLITLQLGSLGVKEIRNVQTAIFYEYKKTYMNYEYYVKHEKSIVTETNYTDNKIHHDFAHQMLKGKGQFYTTYIEKEKVRDWLDYQKTTNVFIDTYLETAPSLNYYWFSLGEVALGCSTYVQLQEHELTLFKRFLNVFDLAYRRYKDIEKAVTQAREAKIESSLERVRRRAMSMRHSHELGALIGTVFSELTRLDIAMTRCVIMIVDPETRSSKWWMANSEDPDNPAGFITQYHDHEPYHIYMEGWEKRTVKMSYSLKGEVKKAWDDFLFTETELALLPVVVIEGMKAPEQVYLNASFNNFGNLTLASLEPLPDESFDILLRFAKVFDLTYTRFNDLKLAEAQAREAEREKKRAEDLILNILPKEIANELKLYGKSYARKHEQVSIMFADIKNFSTISETLSPEELVNQLDECFRAFDHIVGKHGLEKIKTIGDAYVCAGGLPNPDPENAFKMVRAALDMLDFSKGFAMTKTIQDLPAFEFRFGIHTGPVITGVVGLKKFTYDIWGDAVNMAARMEQHGEPNKINVSGSTYQLVKEKFDCTPRGKIAAKNKGEVEMYFVNRAK